MLVKKKKENVKIFNSGECLNEKTVYYNNDRNSRIQNNKYNLWWFKYKPEEIASIELGHTENENKNESIIYEMYLKIQKIEEQELLNDN